MFYKNIFFFSFLFFFTFLYSNNNFNNQHFDISIPKHNAYKNYDTRIKHNKSKNINVLKNTNYKDLNISKEKYNQYFEENIELLKISNQKKLEKHLNLLRKLENETVFSKIFPVRAFNKVTLFIDEKIQYGGIIKKIYVKKGDLIFKNDKIADIEKSSKLLLYTSNYLLLKDKIISLQKTIKNLKELKNGELNEESKQKEIDFYLRKLKNKKNEKYKIEKFLFSIDINPNELKDAISSYTFKSKNEGFVKNIFFLKGQQVNSNVPFLEIEQRDKYFFKTYIPYKYINKLNDKTIATIEVYGHEVQAHFEKILNEYNYEGDLVGVIFYAISPENKIYLDTLSFIKMSFF